MLARSGKIDPDDVGTATDLAVEPLVGVVRPDLSPDLLREGGEGEDVRADFLEVLGDRRELLVQGIDDSVELGVHGLGVGLVVDRVQQRLDPSPRRLRRRRHQVRGVVRPAALPGRAGQARTDR